MVPIEELLNRIRYDRDFGRGNFAIAYYDRVEDRVVRIPLSRLRFVRGEHFFVEVIDPLGSAISLPLHRVTDVYRGSERIWHRELPGGKKREGGGYELWRQDDNGNRFLVGAFADRETAEKKELELSSTGHKQSYWVIEKKDEA